jgi:hypothetical protein
LAFISEKLRYGEVILSINASLIQEGNDGPHAVTIIRDTFYSWTDDDGVEQVRFRVQSWGSDDYEVVGSIEEVGKQINNRLVHVITK